MVVRQATDENTRITAHAFCMLDNKGYIHTIRTCNTYCFSTVTTVTRTHLNITFMCTLHLLFTLNKSSLYAARISVFIFRSIRDNEDGGSSLSYAGFWQWFNMSGINNVHKDTFHCNKCSKQTPRLGSCFRNVVFVLSICDNWKVLVNIIDIYYSCRQYFPLRFLQPRNRLL
jgi:hypothetical protein